MALSILDIRPSEKGSEIVTSAGSFWRVDWWPDKDIRDALAAAHEAALPGHRRQDLARALRIMCCKAKRDIKQAAVWEVMVPNSAVGIYSPVSARCPDCGGTGCASCKAGKIVLDSQQTVEQAMARFTDEMHPIHEEAKALGVAAHADLLKRHGEECAKWAEPLVAARAAADLAAKAEAEAEAAVKAKREAILAYVESHEKDADVVALTAKAMPVAAEAGEIG